jgi:hypothetical protein
MRSPLPLGVLGVLVVATAPLACGQGFQTNTSGSGSGAGGGGGGASTVASSSTGPVCQDKDKDGVTDCAGDCDDNDPTVFPGNTEMCGDGKDNTCAGGTSDPPMCQGIGTYVANSGVDTNPGTQALPVRTIKQGIQNAVKILAGPPAGTGIAVYVGKGHYTEDILMVEGVSVLGAYDEKAGWSRDLASNDTADLCVSYKCVTFPANITRATVFEGFRIEGLKGDGAAHPGTVAVSVDGGSPTLQGNKIHGGESTGGAAFDTRTSVGLRLAGPVTGPGALVQRNEITGGKSVAGSVAIFYEWQAPNSGALATITGNTIAGGQGDGSAGIETWGAVQGNLIQGNDIQAGPSNTGGSWAIIASTANGKCPGSPVPICPAPLLTIDKNTINMKPGVATCAAPQGAVDWCGGIQSESAAVRITNNIVFGAASAKSAAVSLLEREGAAQIVIVNSNLLDGAGVAAGTGGNVTISSALMLENAFGGVGTVVGNVRNNILQGGVGANRYGVYEADNASQPTHTARPNALQNNDFALSPNPNGTGPEWFYRRWNGATQTKESLIACVAPSTACVDSPSAPWATGDFSGAANLTATFHLQKPSPCIDTGVSTEAPPDDREGTPRPANGKFDVGPDEL